MDDTVAQARMWADLLVSETQARHAQHDVTRRAQLYLHAGLPLERVLDALKVSRATWYRRVEAARDAEAEGRAAAVTPLVPREETPPTVEDMRAIFFPEDDTEPRDGDRIRLTYGDGSTVEGRWENRAVRRDDGRLHTHTTGQVRRDVLPGHPPGQPLSERRRKPPPLD